MQTFDITRVDRIFFESNDGISSTISSPQISGLDDNLIFSLPGSKQYSFEIDGTSGLSIFENSASFNGALLVGGQLGIVNMNVNPTTWGLFGTDSDGNLIVRINDGDGTTSIRNLKDIGSGSGGGLTSPIGTDDIANLAVTTEKLSNSAVTHSKLADNAVSTQEIENEAVTQDKLSNAVESTILSNRTRITALEANGGGSIDTLNDIGDVRCWI